MTDVTATRLFTADELLDMPDDGQQHELVRGKLVTMSAGSLFSGHIGDRVGRRIGNFVEDNDLGITCGADRGFRLFHDPDTVRASDYAFVRKERVAEIGFPRRGFWEGAPDLAVEAISPNDRFNALMGKVEEYLLAGTRLVWVLDPERRTTRIFRADGVLDGEDVLPGFRLELKSIWR